MNGPDPNYSIQGALNASQLGYVLLDKQLDLAYAQYAANGFTPLTPPQVSAVLLAGAQDVENWFDAHIVGIVIPPGTIAYPDPLPPLLPLPTCPPMFPVGLPRIPDSNEEPFDNWVEFGANLESWEY